MTPASDLPRTEPPRTEPPRTEPPHSEPLGGDALRRDIASTIRAGRARLVLSQRELADRTGYSQSAIARIEAETSDPRLSCLVAVLAAVDARLTVRDPIHATRMAGDYVRDAAGRRLPAHLGPYRLSRPHDWWPGVTQILMWGKEPRWSYRRRLTDDVLVQVRPRVWPTVSDRRSAS